MVAFTIITGRLFRPWRPADVLTVVLFLALLWIGHRETAREFFYVPYTSNYLIAYAILLAFLIPYRLALLHPSFPRERWLTFALPPLGVAAGLTNEHTPPVYIAMIGIALAFVPMPGQRWRWMASGVAGLVIGFVMLFFAPGQANRYRGIKYSAFDLDGKLHTAGELITHFTAKGGALVIACRACRSVGPNMLPPRSLARDHGRTTRCLNDRGAAHDCRHRHGSPIIGIADASSSPLLRAACEPCHGDDGGLAGGQWSSGLAHPSWRYRHWCQRSLFRDDL